MSSKAAGQQPQNVGASTANSDATPVARRRRLASNDWEDEVDQTLPPSDQHSEAGSSNMTASSSKGKQPRTPMRRVGKVGTNRSPAASRVRTPVQARSVISTKPAPPPRLEKPSMAEPKGKTGESRSAPGPVEWALSILYKAFTTTIGLVHIILAPFYPYIFLTVLALLAASGAIYFLLNVLPPLLFRIPGHILRSILPSLPAWYTPSADGDTAFGQGLALLPLRSLATPACTVLGQMCSLSLLSNVGPEGKAIRTARPFWTWQWKSWQRDQVNIGGVARSLAKEAKGAKDIFESVAQLSDGGMMDRLEYVRVWELGAAIQVGSELEQKDIVAEQLYELGNVAKDLSDELVETNAMAVDAFTWLQWEFSSLVKVLEQPVSSRPPAAVISTRLNSLMDRLTKTLAKLHTATSSAHALAALGSRKGLGLREQLSNVESDLRREQSREPGWKHAVEVANHFFVGGDLSKSARLRKDLEITRVVTAGLSAMVTSLETTRSSIKGFRDQIGFFDASMMGFHLGAGDHVGIGPEEELRILSEVVESFGKSVGNVKSRNGIRSGRKVETETGSHIEDLIDE